MLKKLIYREAVLRKYGIGDFAKKATGISESRIRVHANTPRRQRSTVFQKNITDFFERDDNSRIKAGKKSTITRRKVKKQIRLMNDSLTNLHKKFLYENSSNISFSLFARLKPFWIKRATEKDRETCLCKIHENPILKLNKLASEGVFEHRNLNTLIQDITCDTNSMSCMYHTCTECKDKAFKTNVVKSNINTGKIIEWKMWKNKRIEREITLNGEKQVKKSNMTLKSQESGTIETLIGEMHEEISRLARHEFNIKHQYKRLHQLKQNLTDNEVIIHIDFSENYQCKYASEIQSVHFGSSKRQISIHTGVAYFKSKHISFATVSDDLKHSPPGIWAHLDPILLHIRRTTPDIDKIHFVSDGPTTQYRCKSNFYLFSTKIFEYGFVNGGSWNFMEAGHGKGAPDGIGAVVKREADTLVNTHETDIMGASALMRGLEKLGSRLMIFEVKSDDITQQEAAIPTKITGVPETMKLHQVVVKESGTVQSRILSCFCSPDCSCYQPVTTNFNVQPFANPVPMDDDSIVGPQNGADLPCQILNVPVSIDESLVDSYCLVEYDNKPYPGKITEVDDISVKVSAMHCVGINRYFWPLHKDECWYEKDRIITMLPCEPEKLSGRHQALPLPIWEAVKDKYDL
ncbi:uncharacterized protein LOC127861484 isoform X1 [Dreissena polymorpha]|uniref:uncharacterized protein LOC127861484 isoform X1 n=1 Tax=Dreissena polymorpha TaxID=45954 RepID=UPI002264E39F|nr:uncharacterized protein LOC127861484 isoform X1 [Dreissena polymorpha]